MKARTLLLMCGLSLAGAPAAEAIAPRHGPDGWLFSPAVEGHDVRRGVPHKAEQGAAGETQRQTRAAGMPRWSAAEPVKDNGGAGIAPVSVRDAGGGRVRIEAHDASVGQVLAALQVAGFIRFRASDQLSRTVSGTYAGTLAQVLSRILDGYDYFLHVTASGTEVHAVSASRDTSAASRSGSNDNNAALPNGVGRHVEAAPVPAAAFSLSPANSVSKARARARARAQQAAKTR